ncbi:PhoX family phosphatase [Shewanella sp. UCD-KL12]|uniref:PhoX family protein n=1 Tax=Shewanella sp. UCD-KL12 TaxID=1917163 RepID=UPI00097111D5|nr:PhoX family phosphatase [Shewanella sp. UCD-KL12]
MSKATHDGTVYNKSNNEAFSDVLDKHISRRSMLKTGMGAAGFSLFSGIGLTGCFSSSDPKPDPIPELKLGFDSIAGAKKDAAVVAKGYSAQVLAPWGTPLNDMADDWKSDGSNTALDQANSVGQNHDGMYFYSLNDSSTDGLLCINHEYIQQEALHPNGPTVDLISGLRDSTEEIRKEINAHGISVVRIQLIDGQWQVIKNDEYNRRFTAASEMRIAGPLSGHSELITPFSPTGEMIRGTSNNCGNGFTPWGTYLTCEENWPGYFVNHGELSEQQQRIGISTSGGRYSWEDLAGDETETESEFSRFDITPSGDSALDDYRNEANGYGYIVEIDPHDPQSVAVKRTALGRFRHEGCAYGKVEEGKPLAFYSGHDARFEYIYKFVSDALWDPDDADRTDRLAVGAKYMDEGTLYVARFSEEGVGHWLPLTLEGETKTGGTLADHFNSLAEIILNTAGAADLVGATPMDRPEWTTVDPISGTVYLTLTNNTKRQETNVANPRTDNKFGHIIRWNDVEDSTEFNWDIFVFGSPSDGSDDINLSGLTESNEFACPDGLAFDARGILWVQTDNSGAMEVKDKTNDQMLAVIPTQLVNSDGEADTIHADNQSELRRFFVGPNDCEITGLAFTPDQKNCFLNVQHPGNWPYSMNATDETPQGELVRPRSATVIIRKEDGGEIGV